jgi:hypothetical protein
MGSEEYFYGSWIYEWLDYSETNLILAYFRLMNELNKIEVEGARLKNMMMELLFEDNGEVLKNIVPEVIEI